MPSDPLANLLATLDFTWRREPATPIPLADIQWRADACGPGSILFFQRFDAAGTALGDETLVNVTTGRAQQEPAVAMAADGSMVVAWNDIGPVSSPIDTPALPVQHVHIHKM